MRPTNDSSLARAQREISFHIILSSFFFMLLAAIRFFFDLINSQIGCISRKRHKFICGFFFFYWFTVL